MNWYDDKTRLSGAIGFIRQVNCIYGWSAFMSNKTPCCDYAAEDANIPEGLQDAIRRWYRELSKAERKEVNTELAHFLGEKFYVRESALIKIYSRILSSGDPRDNTNMIIQGLQIQIRQRMDLLAKLA